VTDGDVVDPGAQLTEGPLDPKEVLEIRGVRAAQQYLVDQVQEVYRSQGVEIHDKHIELIVRQMLKRIRVVSANDSNFLPAELVDDQLFRETNKALVGEGSRPAEGRPELMGITKASLATDSWLSAASFQETTRVLTDAAIQGKSDYMRGLKENVIIGKLIPAGTGSEEYQVLQPALPGAATVSGLGILGGDMPMSMDEGLPENPAEWLASLGAQRSAEPEDAGDEEED
jgi:DNA-directed RNA polymerase subunit beta'